MTTKSFTSLEQSKKLAEMLSVESADMHYLSGDEYDICFGRGVYEEIADWICDGIPRLADIPCWSLAALLAILPADKIITMGITIEDNKKIFSVGYMDKDKMFQSEKENMVDACYEMILKLHEQKIL